MSSVECRSNYKAQHAHPSAGQEFFYQQASTSLPNTFTPLIDLGQTQRFIKQPKVAPYHLIPTTTHHPSNMLFKTFITSALIALAAASPLKATVQIGKELTPEIKARQ